MGQLVAAELQWVARGTPVDLNRPTNRSQFQLVADADSTSLGERLWQCDLKLPGHFRHEPMIASIKDGVKDISLIDSVFAMPLASRVDRFQVHPSHHVSFGLVRGSTAHGAHCAGSAHHRPLAHAGNANKRRRYVMAVCLLNAHTREQGG